MARLRVRWARNLEDTPAEGEVVARLTLVLPEHRVLLTVASADGRQLVARFGLDVEAPQVDVDAPADLRDAVIRAWLDRPPTGRPPEQAYRIAAIVDAAVQMGGGASRDRVAQRLGRADDDGRPHSGFKRDVAVAGGWAEIMRRARGF